LQALGPRGVVLTLGAEGVCYRWGKEEGHIPAPRVKVRDTTGAGDAFCGALAVALAEGEDFSSSLRFAVGAAALSVARAGAQEGLPRRGAIEGFLQREGKNLRKVVDTRSPGV
ncbi:MAG: PfkB family carbohydrate kinase, partial [Nitrospinota bacterium]